MHRSCKHVTIARTAAIAALLAAAGTVRADTGDLDLIANGGFEGPSRDDPWVRNNWANNDAHYALDPNNPRSGKQSMRMTMRQATNAGNIQLIHPFKKLPAGSRWRLTFWLRAAQDARRPVRVTIGRRGRPWTTWISHNVYPGPKWKRCAVNLVIPEGVDETRLGLYFYLREETSVWIDDVSMTPLPDRDPADRLEGNRLANGSFEVGRTRWYVQYSPTGQVTGEPAMHETNVGNVPRCVSTDGAPHGRLALKLDVRKDTRLTLTSAYFDLRYGHPASVSFDVLAPRADVTFTAEVGHGTFKRLHRQRRTFTVDESGWQRYRFTLTPGVSESGTYYFALSFSTPGKYLVDRVVVTDGNEPGDVMPPRPDVGAILLGKTPPGNLFDKGDTVRAGIAVQARPGSRDLALDGSIVDVQGRSLRDLSLKVRLNRKGRGRATLDDLPTDRFGAFKLILREKGLDASHRPATELQYQVLPQLPKLNEAAPDSFFGGHPLLKPCSLAVARRVGIRWIRLHPPLDTKWAVVEPVEGRWDFPKAGLKRASAMGFRILGSLDQTPDHRADTPDAPRRTWRGLGNYPPKDWSAWREYVRRVMAAYPFIKHWEVWNEPDLRGFMEDPFDADRHGRTRAELYLKFVRHTRQAVEQSRADVQIAVGAVANVRSEFQQNMLSAGAAKYADIVSFHHYGIDAPDLRKLVRQMQKQTGADGNAVEVWHSEGAGTIPICSWLRESRYPHQEPEAVSHLCAATATQMIAYKAMGVRRYFHYPGPTAGPQGRFVYRNDFAYGSDVSGLPLPLWASYAACVRILEGAQPAGLKELDVDGNVVWRASFLKNDKRIDVVWSKTALPLADLPGLSTEGRTVLDMMGNPAPGRPLTGPAPLYVVE